MYPNLAESVVFSLENTYKMLEGSLAGKYGLGDHISVRNVEFWKRGAFEFFVKGMYFKLIFGIKSLQKAVKIVFVVLFRIF